jgi:hypothetical protein
MYFVAFSQMGHVADSSALQVLSALFFVIVGMVLLAVVSYWFLCLFVIHATDAPCGVLWGIFWNPSGAECTLLGFLGAGDPRHGWAGSQRTMNICGPDRNFWAQWAQ